MAFGTGREIPCPTLGACDAVVSFWLSLSLFLFVFIRWSWEEEDERGNLGEIISLGSNKV